MITVNSGLTTYCAEVTQMIFTPVADSMIKFGCFYGGAAYQHAAVPISRQIFDPDTAQPEPTTHSAAVGGR
ncbi:hypothetical protein IU479_20910 [Nocardia abscessus]|uniref:hypothetical protein n=1 Tax=Nocardia TaxID=1817 RepID=UPI001895213B|nr:MULTISPECIES: hypothetical protein [Nocardia]MBF6220567.1 hypothetical protein [Nocardia abscessus]